MYRSAFIAVSILGTLLAGCTARVLESPAADSAGPTILVGIDAFRWDFMARTETPNLDALAARGVRAERLIPSFPSKTFPNHYTLVTGLYPGHHGLVANNMWDPEFQARYSLGRREEVGNGRWYGGEPIWVTAERQGLVTSPYFWPGSEAEIKGIRPTFWDRYEGSVPNEKRIDILLERLRLPAPQRPEFATVYFSLIDDAAHTYNPDDSPEVELAIRRADGLIGYLIDGLERLGLDRTAHLILVSDHGMAANSRDRAILLDSYVDVDEVNIVDWNPIAALWPPEEQMEATYEALRGAHPNLSVYRRHEIPERYHYRDHPRIPPILAVADEGWIITTAERLRTRGAPGGSHGYDNQLLSMGALFLAAGPSFRQGELVAPFENVHVYELICHLLGIRPVQNDGDLSAVRHLLRR